MLFDIHNGIKKIANLDLPVATSHKLSWNDTINICHSIDQEIGSKLPYLLISPRTDNVPDRG
jgi:hypothetical protein